MMGWESPASLEPVADVLLVDADLIEPERRAPLVLPAEGVGDRRELRVLDDPVVVPAVREEEVGNLRGSPRGGSTVDARSIMQQNNTLAIPGPTRSCRSLLKFAMCAT